MPSTISSTSQIVVNDTEKAELLTAHFEENCVHYPPVDVPEDVNKFEANIISLNEENEPISIISNEIHLALMLMTSIALSHK